MIADRVSGLFRVKAMRALWFAAASVLLAVAFVVWGPDAALSDCAATRSACVEHCANTETNPSRLSACANRCRTTFCQDLPFTCRPGDQRVCNDDSRSCSNACAALAAIPSALTQDASLCTRRCCVSFKACLNQRGCDTTGIDCR
jgi:hypothetical protein